MARKAAMLALLTTTVGIGHEWKMDGDTLAKDDAGNPIWVNGTQELSVKGDTISSLQGESKRHRLRAEAAEGKLEKFNGIEDPDAARQAMETIKDIDTGKLIKDGKLDEVRREITQQFETRIQTAEQKAAEATKRADDTLLDSAFAASEFARERLAVPVEMVRATFGSRFKVEDGKVVAYDDNGTVIYSDKNLGAPASFDEALEKTVSSYKYKDTILKAPDAGGTGGNGGGGSRGKGRTISRADFEALSPVQQAEFAGKMQSGEASISD